MFDVKIANLIFPQKKNRENFLYHTTILTCPASENDLVTSVSIYVKEKLVENNLLIITSLKKNFEGYDFLLCSCIHSPLFNYTNYLEFLQYMEVHRMLGVDHFYLYNFNHSAAVDKLIDYYKSEKLLTVQDWGSLPKFFNLFHYYSQDSVTHDCLYRNMDSCVYMMYVDLDEILIPMTYKTLPEMLFSLKTINPYAGEWSFKNRFFPKDWPIDENITQDVFKPYQTISKTRSETELIYGSSRSKFIVETKRVVTLWIHRVNIFFYSGKPIQYHQHLVDENVGQLFHYRSRGKIMKTNNWIYERRLQTFKRDLLKRLSLIRNKLII